MLGEQVLEQALITVFRKYTLYTRLCTTGNGTLNGYRGVIRALRR